jgi:citrate synthase
MSTIVDPGLERVVAARTRLSDVLGQKGKLTLAGFAAEEIAPRASFEEMLFLLWHDRLPAASELEDLRARLAHHRELPERTMQLLRSAAANAVSPMDALRMAIASLDPGDREVEEQSALLVSQTATIVATYHRLSHGMEPVQPDESGGHVASLLSIIDGATAPLERVRALETYLNTVIDHGLNASTFAARVIIATHTDLVSAVTGAIGALKGPLHGGAPGPALDMVFDIESADRAEPYLREKLNRGERLMGFGHRVYKVRDPRADILAEATRRLYASGEGDEDLYRLATEVEQVALRLLEEYKPGRNLQTNVEYYTALLLHCLGFPSSLFTPTFAVGRVAGWIAHCREQLDTGRLIRPAAEYTGEHELEWLPLEDRA